MESLVHRISLEYRCTNPFQGKRKVANHEDEKSCVNFTDLEVDLRGLITSQGYIGSSPFKRVSYQTCGRRIHLCHSDFNLGPSSWGYRFFFVTWLRYLWLRSLLLLLLAAVSATESAADDRSVSSSIGNDRGK